MPESVPESVRERVMRRESVRRGECAVEGGNGGRDMCEEEEARECAGEEVRVCRSGSLRVCGEGKRESVRRRLGGREREHRERGARCEREQYGRERREIG